MFSLIIVIISIALVAALAIATVYYGGDIQGEAKASADASQALTSMQQVHAAALMYRSDHRGESPSTPDDLVAGGYLKALPVGTGTQWTFGENYLVSVVDDSEACRQINEKLNFSLQAGQDETGPDGEPNGVPECENVGNERLCCENVTP